MEDLSTKYRLSIYKELVELDKKIHIVKSTLDNKIFIKKTVEKDNYEIYKKIKELNIPNIPEIYEIIILEDKLIIIEEYINGYSLKEVLDKNETLDEKKVIQCTLDLLSILKKLHSSKPIIIHRDIKPANIMISNDGILKLIDFDISRIHKKEQSVDTIVLGTHGFAAPEQFGFNQSDERTDIYSIGITMNVMVTGYMPTQVLYDGSLGRIIRKCIEMDPKKRYQTIDLLKESLLKEKFKVDKIDENKNNKLLRSKFLVLFLKVLKFLWYGLIFMGIMGFLEPVPMTENRISNIGFGVLLLSLTLLYSNYKNIKRKLPMLKSSNKFAKIFGYFFYTSLIITVLSFLNLI